ncbi:MAG: nucleotidyltransferase [Dehalococcoidia bacterium]|nr:nucleotidyltransferase [Dehalococcoidia bacterium]
MGSGSRDGYVPPPTDNLIQEIQERREEARRQLLDGDVNRFLRSVLASCERDPAQSSEHLDQLKDALSEDVEMERFLFGGSVAKHTFVDGLSDIDALVVLTPGFSKAKTPTGILHGFDSTLQERLPEASIREIRKGELAVTVAYRDGTEVQLLPAIQTRGKLAIRNVTGRGWLAIEPGRFHKALSQANRQLGGVLVPTIKLVKSMVSSLPEQHRPTGYHIESLCLKAVEQYKGPCTPKALLPHVFNSAAELVRKPMRDVTGQSRSVDANLGPADSGERKAASRAFAAIAKRLNQARSLAQWMDTVGGTNT